LIHKGFNGCRGAGGSYTADSPATFWSRGWILVAASVAVRGRSAVRCHPQTMESRILKHRLIQAAADTLLPLPRASVQPHPPNNSPSPLTAMLLGGAGATFAPPSLAPDALICQSALSRRRHPPAIAGANADLLQPRPLNLYRSRHHPQQPTRRTLLKRLGIYDPQAAAFLRSDRWCSKPSWGRTGATSPWKPARDNTLLKLSARWSPKTTACSSACC
jgi:hypothetical protein